MRIDHAFRPTDALSAGAPRKAEGSEDFGNMLMDALKEVNEAQSDSREKQNLLMANRPVDVDDLMISMEKASVAMQLTLQVRNKLLEGYQEIIRTQI